MTPTTVRSEEPQTELPTPCADATGDASVAVGAAYAEDAGVLPVGGVRDGSSLLTGALLSSSSDGGETDDELGSMSADQFTRVAKALADPRRFTILEIIAAHGEIACQRLCCELPVKQATVSHHVKELSAAGLVETRRDGQFVYYRYVPTVMRQYAVTLTTRLAA